VLTEPNNSTSSFLASSRRSFETNVTLTHDDSSQLRSGL
jgi:hypothetical protein